jgi:ankyrin repeat protein
LSEAVIQNDQKLAEFIVRKGGRIFNKEERFRDYSPFFVAINMQSIWAVEMFCDHGANINTKSSSGQNPLIYAASRGFDDTSMYLCLRSKNLEHEDEQTGLNIFLFYLMKQDLKRMKQILMRGANINYCSVSKGLTALHLAIEAKFPEKVIKFLLK